MTGVQTCALPICFPVTILTFSIGFRDLSKSANGFFNNVVSIFFVLNIRFEILEIRYDMKEILVQKT